MLAFAGLYEFWGPPGQTLTTCTIITSPAEGELAEIHDRMPLVLPRSAWARWLDPAVSDPADLLVPGTRPAASTSSCARWTSPSTRSSNNGPELLRPADRPADPEPQRLF